MINAFYGGAGRAGRRLSFFAALALAQVAHAGPIVEPKIFFQYTSLFEQYCTVQPLPGEVSREAGGKVPHFRKIWEREGPALLQSMARIFGKGFRRSEFTATLSACPARSISTPLILNIRPYLKSVRGSRVSSDLRFAHLVFHELIHTWVVDNVRFPTPLTTKYQRENRTVLSHLHLMAVQKRVYSHLDREDFLVLLSLYDSWGEDYRRAWEIVDQIEGVEAFLREVR